MGILSNREFKIFLFIQVCCLSVALIYCAHAQFFDFPLTSWIRWDYWIIFVLLLGGMLSHFFIHRRAVNIRRPMFYLTVYYDLIAVSLAVYLFFK